MTRINEFGQPIGDPVDWSPRAWPQPVRLVGDWVRLDPLAPRHAPSAC
ncbi:MAG: hypothetical protein Q4G46_06820 [Propionibacteriaceae bacterium]|nr:hypothetical protein [Propionibacteriaceae bacterium]